jgi:hypothetical protein
MSKATHLATALIVLSSLGPMWAASAISLQVARKCDAATYKAFPPRVVGNPAAGSSNGTGRSEEYYFSRCVANAEQHHK